MNMSQLKPSIFDRDRSLKWNLLGLLAPRSKYGVGNEWKHFAEEDGSLRCEECGSAHGKAVMIVNDPFTPEEPVDFDSPTQVLCRTCVRGELPIDSPYREENKGVKSGSTAELSVEDLDALHDAIGGDQA